MENVIIQMKKWHFPVIEVPLSARQKRFFHSIRRLLAITYLKELGIWPSERDGYYYPSSGQAASVAECLLMEAKRLGIVIHTDSPVNAGKK